MIALVGKLEVTVRLQQLPLLPGMQKADENILTVFAVFSIFNSSPRLVLIFSMHVSCGKSIVKVSKTSEVKNNLKDP